MSEISRLLSLNEKANKMLSSAHSKIEWESMDENSDLPDQKVIDDSIGPYSVYVHLPFCERYCTFCGCNTSITGDHSWEDRYIKLLEIEKRHRFGEDFQMKAKRLVLAGGTPTFFSTKSLKRLLKTFFVDESVDHYTTIEIDPRYCSHEHIEFFGDHSFSQFKLALVDINSEVQKLIGRRTDRVLLETVCEQLSEQKGSLQVEWLLGLPGQNDQSQAENLNLLKQIVPDEVVINRFIQVPWLKDHQKSYSSKDIPSEEQVGSWEQMWIEQLVKLGYTPLGFGAWVKNETAKFPWSKSESRISKDLSGLYPFKMDTLLGFGVGAQSMGVDRVSRNYSALPVYQREIERGHTAVEKVGHYSEAGLLANQTTNQVLNYSLEELKAMNRDWEISDQYLKHFSPLFIALKAGLIKKEQILNE